MPAVDVLHSANISYLEDLATQPRAEELMDVSIPDAPVADYENPLHLDVVDWYLRRMGDKTIQDEAPPSLESFYPPFAAGINLPQSKCSGFFVSSSPINTNKGVF